MRRLQEVNVGIIVPAAELEKDPLDNAVALMSLSDAIDKNGAVRCLLLLIMMIMMMCIIVHVVGIICFHCSYPFYVLVSVATARSNSSSCPVKWRRRGGNAFKNQRT